MTVLVAPGAGVAPSGRKGLRPAGVVGAFLRRDAAQAVSYRLPFVLGLGQSVLGLAFVFFLGRLVGHRLTASVSGMHVSYFAFAVVGTTLLVLFNAVVVSMAQRLRTDQTTGTLEVLFTMPVPGWLTVLSSAAYPLASGVALAAVTLATATAMGLRFHVSAASAGAGAAAFVASLALFGAAGVGLAAFVLVFKRGETLTALVGTALSLVGGVYYPVQLLPHDLRIVADTLPFTWALQVLRTTLLQGEVPLARLTELAGSAALALPLAVVVFSAALRRARRAGTLAQY